MYRRTPATYRGRAAINADGFSSVISGKAQNTADKSAVSCRNRLITADKSAVFFRNSTITDEKSAVICAEARNAVGKSAVIYRAGSTTDGKSAVSAFCPGVGGSEALAEALCGFSRGLVLGGGSPHVGKAESRSGRRTRSRSQAGSSRKGGDPSCDDEGDGQVRNAPASSRHSPSGRSLREVPTRASFSLLDGVAPTASIPPPRLPGDTLHYIVVKQPVPKNKHEVIRETFTSGPGCDSRGLRLPLSGFPLSADSIRTTTQSKRNNEVLPHSPNGTRPLHRLRAAQRDPERRRNNGHHSCAERHGEGREQHTGSYSSRPEHAGSC
jgi:hypothetical protein